MYRAFQPEQDRLVAVKAFRLDLPPERVHRFVAELEKLIAAALTHPGIATPIAAGISGTTAYLAQEFVAADSLDIVVRDYGPAPPPDAVRVAAQLAGALDFAAVVNVTHGALHPRDVLVSPEDTRLTGLGIAHALEALGVPAAVRRPYTAPERVADGRWDRRADVFSLAAVVYELLFGRRVVGSGDQVGDTVTELPGSNVRHLRAVFTRALADDPGERFDSALAFAEELKSAFVFDVPSIAAPGPASAATRPQRAGRVSASSAPVEGQRDSRAAAADGDAPRLPLDAAAPMEADAAVTAMPRGGAGTKHPDGMSGDAVSAQPPLERVEPSVADVELRAAEDGRYDAVESAPSAPVASGEVRSAAHPIPHGGPGQAEAVGEPHAAALPRGPKLWPLVIVLLLGAAIGASIAVLTLNRSRTGAANPNTATQTAAPAPVAPAALDSTRDAAQPADAAASDARARTTASADAPAGQSTTAPGPTAQTARGEPDTPRPGRSADRAAAAPGRSPATAEISGRLLVRSSPSGARVTVDGRDAGVTPATLRDVARGTHTIRVSRQGYVSQERRVTISAARPAQSVTVELARPPVERVSRPSPSTPATRSRFTGRLAIDSRPAGARVYLDGKSIGITPVEIQTVDAGSHAVRIEREGYQRWTSAVRVVAGERNRVTASLER